MGTRSPVRLWNLTRQALCLAVAAALAAVAACSDPEQAADESAADTSDEADVLESTDEFKTAGSALGPRDELPGAALYAQHCASCHNGSVYKAPHFHWLEMMPAHSLHKALDTGIMQAQAASLDAGQKIDVVEYLTRKRFDPAAARIEHRYCAGDAAGFDMDRADVKVGWGHDNSRFVPAELAGLDVADIARLKLKWAYAFPGATRARSQPGYAMGTIFVGSEAGIVHAFDLETGCVRWAYEAMAEVRTGVVYSGSADNPLVYFGDIVANVYAVNALTGEIVWTRSADDHPSATLTGTPSVYGQTLYVPVSSLEVIAAADPHYECCTFRGKVMAINGLTGEVLWESYSIPKEPGHYKDTTIGTRVLSPSGAPVWTSPTIDAENDRLYFGTGENYSSPADDNSDAMVAVNLGTGERLWHKQFTPDDAWNVACMMAGNPNCPEEDGPDFDQGSSPILIDTADVGQLLVVGHKNGSISGHDPERRGETLWMTKVGRGSIQGGVHFGMAAEGRRVYMPINDMNNTRNGDILDPEQARPGMHAVDAVTGEVLWSTVRENICSVDREFCDPGISAPATAIPGAVFAGHLDGYLVAYDGETGDVLWEYNTATDIEGINGVTGRGGSMSGAGPLVIDGHVISNSGYGLYFHEAGNLLMVFSVDGE